MHLLHPSSGEKKNLPGIFPRLFLRMTLPALMLAAVFQAQGQQKLLTGKVLGAESGAPVGNASVMVKESRRGTVTDNAGTFKIAADAGQTLVVSAVGYSAKEVKVTTQPDIVIRLKSSANTLNDVQVVTTALGIKKQARSLGYAVTKIDSSQLTDAVSSNWLDALSGKVAGLTLVRSGSGPDASSKIILRGENNLTGDNEALIVVDGVVINNSSGKRSANSSDQVYGTGSDNMPADYGSSVNDINPQDIESVSVLKGPAAAALYGQRAANGAIIITTKSSSQRKKGHFNVKYVVNGSIEQINRYPDLQYEYGQGLGGALYYSYGATVDGASTSGTSSAYGPKFDGQSFYQYNPVTQARDSVRTQWRAYNNINDFWNTGKDLRNNLSIDGKIFGNTGIRINMGTENDTWIVPNTGYKRQSIGFTSVTDITKKIKLSTKVNYGYRGSGNLPGAGYGNQSLMYWYIFWQPSADYNWLRNYWSNNNPYQTIKYPFSSYPSNPFAIVNEYLNKTNRNNVTANATLNYQVTKDFGVLGRYNIDWSGDHREQDRPYGAGVRLPKGSVRKQHIISQEQSYDIMGVFNKRVSPNLKLGVTLGASQLWNKYNKTDVRADGLKYPTVPDGTSPYPAMYNLDSSLYGLVYYPDTSRYQINSLYGIVNLNYKDVWYTEITARNDWNSVLAARGRRKDGVGFFYPSLNTSLVLSDIAKMPSFINYAKLRASIAQVGSGGTTPYQTLYSYPLASGGIYPDSAVTNPTTMPDVNLKPLITTTFELGGEAQLFHNRLGLDVAVYFGNTRNQILTRVVDASSGYTNAVINAGKVRNNGVEVQLDAKPIITKGGFNWSLTGTFSYNQNKIMSMPDSSVVLQSGPVASAQLVAKVGGSMGDLYGLGYVRHNGQVVFDPSTGFPLITDSIIHLGNTIPKYRFSLGNTFNYKRFTLHVLFDAQVGAVAYSLTNYKMVEQGKLKVTLPGRYNGIVGNGVVENADGTYRKNDVVAYDVDQYYQHSMGSYNAEGSVFSTNYLKFREATISYSFGRNLLRKVGLASASVGIFGRDLFIWSPWPIFDPEFGTLAGSDIVRGFEIGQFPSTRTIGFNLTIGF